VVDNEASQALAYYDPKKKAFFVVKTGLPENELRTAAIHELDHALQDARFDLEKMRSRATASGEEDRANALTFLVEGEATYVMEVAVLKEAGAPAALADMAVEAEASFSRERLLEKLKESAEHGDEGAKPRREAYESALRMPLYIYRTLVEPYTRGAAFVARVHRRGGWKAVDALFRDPPVSTSQVLHPELVVTGRKPASLSLPDLAPLLGKDWALLREDALGELGLDCFLEERLGKGHEDVAPGLRGDRLRAYKREDRTAVVWLTTWETDEDAKAFETAATAIARADSSRLRAGEASRVVRSGRDAALGLGLPEDSSGAILEQALAGSKRPR
jgi:hypothetical protein